VHTPPVPTWPRHQRSARYSSLFVLLTPRPPGSTLFPYTTLFRSLSLCPPDAQPPRERPGPGDVYRMRPRRGCSPFWIGHKQRKRSEEHTSELQSRGHLVCRLLLEKKNKSVVQPHLTRHRFSIDAC